MSVFCFPRIHVKGLLSINVGTGNNDDYSNLVFPKGSPFAGTPLRLADSVNVRPLTYGMSDADLGPVGPGAAPFRHATRASGRRNEPGGAPCQRPGRNDQSRGSSRPVRGDSLHPLRVELLWRHDA